MRLADHSQLVWDTGCGAAVRQVRPSGGQVRTVKFGLSGRMCLPTMSAHMVTLHDAQSAATAQILVSQGFNCFAFQVPDPSGPLDVIWSEPGFAAGDRRPSGSGIPLLFPFPGRIAGTTFHWQGQSYELTAGDGRGNAIHGFVHERPWRIVQQQEARVVGQFQASVDDPALLQALACGFPDHRHLPAARPVPGGALRAGEPE